MPANSQISFHSEVQLLLTEENLSGERGNQIELTIITAEIAICHSSQRLLHLQLLIVALELQN